MVPCLEPVEASGGAASQLAGGTEGNQLIKQAAVGALGDESRTPATDRAVWASSCPAVRVRSRAAPLAGRLPRRQAGKGGIVSLSAKTLHAA